MPELNGVDAARQILKHNPDQVILVLTAVDSEQVIRECLEAGIRGWVFKSAAAQDLMTAVEALQRQKTIFSSRVADLIMDGYKRHRAGPTPVKVTRLSPVTSRTVVSNSLPTPLSGQEQAKSHGRAVHVATVFPSAASVTDRSTDGACMVQVPGTDLFGSGH
jgi:DNA-binding response OmpR family regulator